MRNYNIEKKLEHFITLQAYMDMEKEPVSTKNCGRYLEKQNRRVHEIMEAAWKWPFYREMFEQTQTTPDDYHCAEDLYKFPVINKDQVRAWMDGEAEKNPELFADWHITPTSGSTGEPLRVLVSPREHAWFTANWLRAITLPGYNPFTGKTLSRPNTLHYAATEKDSIIQDFGILRHKTMSDTNNNTVDTETLLRQINDYKPDFLYNHKNILVRIAKYVKETGAYLWKPKYLAPISEQLDDPSREILQEVFDCRIVNCYGMNETGTCAVQLPGKKYFQTLSDTHVINVYTPDLKEPAMKGPIVLTCLFKTDMPIINYVGGDNMDTYIKRGLRFARSIQGRANDVILHRDGRASGWGNVSGTMNYIDEIIQYRFIQEDYEHLTIQAVRNPDVPESEQPAIEKKVIERIDKSLGGDFSYKFIWMDEIPSDPNGKLRTIISKIKQ